MNYKKLTPNAIAPKRATEGSAGYDLYVPEDTYIKPGRNIVPLGIALEIPFGYMGKIESRSGFASKGMEGADGIRHDADVISGKIDSDYRDGIGVIINNHEGYPFQLKAGTRIAQMIFYKVEYFYLEEANELSETARLGGFGSTGV